MASKKKPSTDAKNQPTGFTKTTEPMEMDQGTPEQPEFSTDDSGDQVIEIPSNTDVDSPPFKAKADYEKFMADPVKIKIHTTSEKHADKKFMIKVNGKAARFVRGEVATVPRYIVEGLCRAKPISYENEEYINSQGDKDYRYIPSTGLRYGFSVLEDPRGSYGDAWLENLLQQVA